MNGFDVKQHVLLHVHKREIIGLRKTATWQGARSTRCFEFIYGGCYVIVTIVTNQPISTLPQTTTLQPITQAN